MTGKKKKFSYYNDYSTVNFGGSSGRSGRSSSSGSGRSRRGSKEHTWCDDCDKTGKCLHCKDGYYPRRDGSNAPCSKCRGSLTCHACRGSRLNGERCGTPRYEQTVEKLKGQNARGIASGIASAAIAVFGAYGEPTQSGDTTQHKWSESQMRADGRRRGDTASDATRDQNRRRRGGSQQ